MTKRFPLPGAQELVVHHSLLRDHTAASTGEAAAVTEDTAAAVTENAAAVMEDAAAVIEIVK